MLREKLLSEIKKTILQQQPRAEIILFGSFARNEQRQDSDIDILILLDKDKIDKKEKKELLAGLYNLELIYNKVISPVIKAKKSWQEKYPNTGLFINIKKEGQVL